MAHSIHGAFKPNRNDELFTPQILVNALYEPMQKFVQRFRDEHNRSPTVWCPFDLDSSEFVIFFRDIMGLECIATHIDTGQDFFSYTPDVFDIIISNPPFSRKLDVFKRLNVLGKPWAMLSNIMCLNYQIVGNYFADNPVQLLIVDKRVSFDGNPSSFNSSYFCKDFLERDLMFTHLAHCNSGKDFIPSRMKPIDTI